MSAINVLFIGGPADGRRMTINPRMVEVHVPEPEPGPCYLGDAKVDDKATFRQWVYFRHDWADPVTRDAGFREGFRVLRPGGTLIFKWNEDQILTKEITALSPIAPACGHPSGKRAKTQWVTFWKGYEMTLKKTHPYNREKVRIRAGSFEHAGYLLGSPKANPWEGKLYRPPEADKTFTVQPSDNNPAKAVICNEIGYQMEVDLERVDAILAESVEVPTIAHPVIVGTSPSLSRYQQSQGGR